MQSAADIMVLKFRSEWASMRVAERNLDKAEEAWLAEPENGKLERLFDAAYKAYHYYYCECAGLLARIISESAVPGFTEKKARKMMDKYGERIEQLVAML